MKQKCIILGFFLVVVAMHSSMYGAVDDSLFTALGKAPTHKERSMLATKISLQYLKSDYQMAVNYAQMALENAELAENDTVVMKSLNLLGSVYMNLGVNDLAFDYLYQYLLKAEKLKLPNQIAYALANIASSLLLAEDYINAKKYYFQALTKGSQVLLNTDIANIYNGLGYCYKVEELIDSASFYFDKALLLLSTKEEEEQALFFKITRNMAELNIIMQESIVAEQQLNEILNFYSSQQQLTEVGHTYILLAKAKLLNSDTLGAILFARNAFNIGTSTNGISLIETSANFLYTHYDKLKKTDSAFVYFQAFNTAKGNRKNAEAKQALIVQELTNAYNKLQESSKLSKHKNKLNMWLISSIGALLLAVFGGLLFKRKKQLKLAQLANKRKLSQIDMLLEEKKQVEAQVEEKEKEITTKALYEIKKNTVINRALQSLNELQEGGRVYEFKHVVKQLEQIKDNDTWEEFEMHFQNIHSGFYKKLHLLYPNLTNNERKLCAFLLLNMSTKEIAALTGQTLRAVELSRIRLRKKLKITNESISIHQFLSEIDP